MGYNQEAKDAMDRLRSRLSPEVVEACAGEIVRLGPEALRLCLTFPEPLVFPASRHWIVSIALRMPREAAVPVLLEALGHPDWRIHQIATDALSKLGTEVKDALVEYLGTCTVPGGRIQALHCLHRLADPFGPLAVGDKSLIAPIAKAAANDESPEVRAFAITVLSRSEAHEAEDTIAQALEDPSEAVRLAAMQAAGRLRLKACVPALLKMLDHEDAEVRADVLYALDRIASRPDGTRGPGGSDASAAAVARERLDDDSFYVRWSAVGALENLWEDANAPALESAANDENTVVATAAREVLQRRGRDVGERLL